MDIDDMWDDEEDLQQFSRVTHPRITKSQSEVSIEYAEIAHLRQQVATLTEQRDMAVEAVRQTTKCLLSGLTGGNVRASTARKALEMADEALAAIQSSEVKK
jgi:hypothetical protein